MFNANMAPNGMMQVWTGLMLRVDNEAQLATVLGHEIGHYLQRHSVDQLRDAKTRAAFGQFLGLFGVAGLLGQLGMVAGMFAYGQDHEREADAIGIRLMRNAGYDPAEAAKVWENLLLEIRARPEGERSSPFFATHPPPAERLCHRQTHHWPARRRCHGLRSQAVRSSPRPASMHTCSRRSSAPWISRRTRSVP